MTTLTQEIDSKLFAIAPCLEAGDIAAAGRDVIDAAAELGKGKAASALRAWGVVLVFDGMERAFAGQDDPTPAIQAVLRRLAYLFRVAKVSGVDRVGSAAGATQDSDDATSVAEVTGQHYGELFRNFATHSYRDEPMRLLMARLSRNDVQLPQLHEQVVLDAGCGGGRYTLAWRLMGAKQAVGVDISETGLADARKRIQALNVDGVEFRSGSVLNLPIEDQSVDIAFSNGVLHHTTDWRRGLSELVRVLRPGGVGWLYLIEKPGGLFWDLVEILRVIMQDDQHDAARSALEVLGVPGNRAFYMLDHVMVPINVRLTPEEVERSLREAGATQIRRLQRGADFDRVEQIYQKSAFAQVKYGVGENRYVFSRS
jgi:ubiquinone/menaquinone biosynthesis C-methylase UbiE